MTGYHVIVEADDDRDDAKAREVAEILATAYPGHPWHVRIGAGVIVIKHAKIAVKHGMVRHYNRITFNAKVLKREIIYCGGELLERAGLTRSAAREGDVVRKVDGLKKLEIITG